MMIRYSSQLREQIRELRSQGKTYREINTKLGVKLAKSTLSHMCRNVILPKLYIEKIAKLTVNNASKARAIAIEINKIKRKKFFDELQNKNAPVSRLLSDKNIAKIALAMLCLGEASKYGNGSVFYLGNSNPKIIILFLELLKKCFNFDVSKVRCTVQCRADQDTKALELFWQKITGIPQKNFYKSRIDPRTIGKPTKRKDYKGVLRIEYFDTKIQLELESLASLLYNQVTGARGEPAYHVAMA